MISSKQLRAWRAFLEAHAAVTRRLNEDLEAEQGFPLSWYDVLVQLEEAGGILRMHELADSLLSSRSATTRFVDRLENKGFLKRSICGEDRRGMNVEMTAQGRDALRQAAPGHLTGVFRHFSEILYDAETECLAEALERIAQANRDHS